MYKILFIGFVLFNSLGFACDSKLEAYSIECQMADRYDTIRNQYFSIGADIENVAIYKALRFIDRKSYEKARANNVAVEMIYKPAPLTWSTWSSGVEAAGLITAKISQNTPITLNDIKELHKAAIVNALMTKTSRFLKGAKPGRIRSHFWQRAPEFTFSCDEKNGKDVADLITNYDLKTNDEKPLINGSATECSDGASYSGHVMYLKSRRVRGELNSWLSDFNNYISNIHNQIDNKISPIVFIADMQRRFVSIHPFGDGNGRMSRLLQDAFLKALGLPYPVSADLSQDLFMNQDLYRAAFWLKLDESLINLERCLDKSNATSYDCQILKTKTSRDPASFFSSPKDPAYSYERVAELSPHSFIKSNIKSCYRWMSKYEYRKWIKNKEPIFYEIQHSGDHLKRGGLTEKGIYCWENTVGAVAGGAAEIYGDQLVRIDFVNDATLYDRNRNQYYNVGDNNIAVAEENKKGIDSDIFYANYWFQEYIIKSPKAIRGWTFGDAQLKMQIANDIDKLMKKQFTFADFHYSTSYCPLDRSVYDRVQSAYCDKYMNIVIEKYNNLLKYWEQNPESV